MAAILALAIVDLASLVAILPEVLATDSLIVVVGEFLVF